MIRLSLIAVVSLQLVACGTSGPVPVDAFYRLPDARISSGSGRLSDGPVVVTAFDATDLHKDRAIIFSDTVDYELKRHHYHFWVESPPRLLQTQLAQYLRDSGAAMDVKLMPIDQPAVNVTGRIQAFERVVKASGTTVRVALQLRVEAADGSGEDFVNDYSEQIEIGSTRMVDSVAAFGQAVERIYARFVADALQSID